jgi:hypothetical protein
MEAGYRKASIPWVRRKARMGRSGRAITCNLSLSTILFARAKEVSHFEPETGQPR